MSKLKKIFLCDKREDKKEIHLRITSRFRDALVEEDKMTRELLCDYITNAVKEFDCNNIDELDFDVLSLFRRKDLEKNKKRGK
jgi:hypothetical protein